jgi:coenzyme F420 hydrogenase subunit beta
VYAGAGSIMLEYIHKKGMFYPKVTGDHNNNLLLRMCPGMGYNIIELARKVFGKARNYDVDLGQWISFFACRSSSPAICENATSGGLMTAIAHYLISTGKVDGAIVTGMVYGQTRPMPKVYIASNLEDLVNAQGSKYCPVPTLAQLKDLLADKNNQKFVFIGLPCQIAGLRLLQEEFPELKKNIPLTIGNFCGGFRDYRETEKLIKRQNIEPRDVTLLRYRGGGQPGYMLIQALNGRECKLPYPDYAKLTGINKHYRCRVCIDATAELADFACGDAWVDRFLLTGKGWSLVMTRSVYAETIMKEMLTQKLINCESISIDELKESQRGNLDSKKTRQAARRKLCGLLGFDVPTYDGGYPQKRSSVIMELKVFISHFIFNLAEGLGCYPLLAKLLRRRV